MLQWEVLNKMKKKTLNKKRSDKIKEIMEKGVRKNTHKPVSKKNPRRKVSQKQAVAISYNSVK